LNREAHEEHEEGQAGSGRAGSAAKDVVSEANRIPSPRNHRPDRIAEYPIPNPESRLSNPGFPIPKPG
jgi:hypothetical protein